ncbi:tyrosine-type recombinase/integrase [Humisphaera borealis]|uniref:Site-specific integrase n=1 Tax=Humisphaera borealis TaxID=2807512 RepID=A0A7M2WZN8_9BACT|nr:site-specific integrase [Humisphaera borealis]QOV90968.1 site-specific integrase [Humisphaera borealis]
MPRKAKNPPVQCRYFTWKLRQRNDVWFADGRSGELNLGRHSLNTRDLEQARQLLADLDLEKAIETGRASPSARAAPAAAPLELEVGRQRYFAHVGRAPQLGGARPQTVQRYKAVFDKFFPWLRDRGIRHWNGVDRHAVADYITWLDEQDHSSFTLYLEGTTIKQAVNHLIRQSLLPPGNKIELAILRAETTTRYCWREEEVVAMIEQCFADPKLHWLGYVLVGLATTGLRIGELASRKWSDFDLENGVIRLSDHRLRSVRSKRHQARTTKGKRDRSFPIHPHLRAILEQLPRHPDGYVFRAACGGKLDDDKVRKSLIRDVQKPLAKRFPSVGDDELGFADGTPHSFRHYFVVAAVHVGVNQRTIQDWLGHRDSKMVAWYYHQFSEQSQVEMNKLKEIAGGSDAAWRQLLPPVNNEGSTPRQNDVLENT